MLSGNIVRMFQGLGGDGETYTIRAHYDPRPIRTFAGDGYAFRFLDTPDGKQVTLHDPKKGEFVIEGTGVVIRFVGDPPFPMAGGTVLGNG